MLASGAAPALVGEPEKLLPRSQGARGRVRVLKLLHSEAPLGRHLPPRIARGLEAGRGLVLAEVEALHPLQFASLLFRLCAFVVGVGNASELHGYFVCGHG